MNRDHLTTSIILYFVAVRHSQLRHPVQGGAPHQQLRGLSIKAARRNSSPEDQLEPKHGGFGQRASVVIALLLPSAAAHFPNPPQVLITWQTLLFGIAVSPDPGITPWRNHGLRVPFLDCPVAIAFVIRAIAGDLLDLALHL